MRLPVIHIVLAVDRQRTPHNRRSRSSHRRCPDRSTRVRRLPTFKLVRGRSGHSTSGRGRISRAGRRENFRRDLELELEDDGEGTVPAEFKCTRHGE